MGNKIKLTESQLKKVVTETIKKVLNEIGPKYAAKALSYNGRDRNTHNKAMVSLFSKYIGSRNLPFYIKIMDGQPTRYELIEVVMGQNFDNVKFYFDNVNDDAEYTNAPFSPNKKDVIITYDIKKDEYNGIHGKLSPYFSNFLVKAAKLLKEAYFTQFKVTPDNYDSYKLDKDETGYRDYYNDLSKNPRYQKDSQELTDKAKQTKYTKRTFNTFDHDSNNLLNKG